MYNSMWEWYVQMIWKALACENGWHVIKFLSIKAFSKGRQCRPLNSVGNCFIFMDAEAKLGATFSVKQAGNNHYYKDK